MKGYSLGEMFPLSSGSYLASYDLALHVVFNSQRRVIFDSLSAII